MNHKSWRTLVRFHLTEMDGDDRVYWICIPSWNHRILLRKTADDIPKEIRERVEEHDGIFRCHAKVNTGVKDPECLVFKDWERG